MIRFDPDRRRTLATLAMLAGAAGGCATGAAVPAPAGADPLPVPTLGVGDRWSWRLVNRYNGGSMGELTETVTAVTPEIRIRVEGGGAPAPLAERYADPWRVVEETTFEHPVTFDVPMPLVPPAARPGAAISTSGRYTSPFGSGTYAWQQRLRAVRWERITVPAGTFDALRIDRLVNLEHPDRFRYFAERTDVLWVSPQVGRWVAREWTGSFMPGSPTGRAGRAREDWVRWELTGWQAGGRGG